MKTLFEIEKQKLLRYCMTILNNCEDAEDAIMDTYLRSYYVAEINTALLYRIAHNVCIDMLKKTKKNNETVKKLCYIDYPDFDSEPAYTDIHRCIGLLPQRQALAIWLKYWENMNISEIASIMDTSYKTVDMLLVHAKQKLRKLLSEN